MFSTLVTAGQDSGRPSDSVTGAAIIRRRVPVSRHVLALLLLSLFAWAPLLYPGYLQVHAGFLPVLNLADLAAVSDRLHWLPHVGVNEDLLRGEGPLAYWLALAWRPWLGDIDAIKALFALSLVAGGLGVYRWLAWSVLRPDDGELAGRAGLLAAVVYLLWPHLLATVYVRGALAEAVFMALVPGVLAGVAGVKRRVSRGGWRVASGEWRAASGRFAAAVGVALLVGALFWVQAGLALWVVPLLLVWALWPGGPLARRLIAATAVLIGAGLGGGLLWALHGGTNSAGPAVLDFAAHAVHPYQLLAAGWGHGISTPGWQDDLPLQLGLAALGLAMLATVLLLARHGPVAGDRLSVTSYQLSVNGYRPAVTAFALVSVVVLVLLTTTLARPLWRALPMLARPLTYPWQLNALVGPLLALLAGSVVLLERRLAAFSVWAGLVALVVLSSYSYLTPRYTQVQPDPATAVIFGDNQVTLLTASVQTPSPALPLSGEGQVSVPFTVTVSWQALQPLDFDYNVFVHALDAEGKLITQWDGQPQRDGQPYPMTAWTVGEIVTDAYRLEVAPADLASIRRVNLGLYNWRTGERLAAGRDDKVTLEVAP